MPTNNVVQFPVANPDEVAQKQAENACRMREEFARQVFAVAQSDPGKARRMVENFPHRQR